MVHNDALPNFHNFLPAIHLSRYNLSISDDIPVIRGCAVIYDKSFLPKTICDWNSLPATTLNTVSSRIEDKA